MTAEAVLDWSGTFIPAHTELTDSEIVDRYGSLMQAAVSAFRTDPTYVVDMAEAAGSLLARRKSRGQSRV